MKSLLLYLILPLFLFNCQQRAKKINPDILIQNVNIIDVKNGRVLHNKAVAILEDKISSIFHEKVKAGGNTKVIDATGKYLIPGLWEMHGHYYWNYKFSSPLLVANGITGLREMWGVMDTINRIRSLSRAGKIMAPDIYTAGAIIDGVPPIWPGSSSISTKELAIAEVDRQVGLGVDFLKVYSRLSKDNYLAIAQRSNERGIPFAGHIPADVSIWEAIDAGQQSAEHFYGLLAACTNDPKTYDELYRNDRFSDAQANFLVESFDRTLFNSLAKKLAESDTWLCPTLSAQFSSANLDDTTLLENPNLSYLPNFMIQIWTPRNRGRGTAFFDARRRKFRFQQSLLGDLEKVGVKILAGTDFSVPFCYPGFSLHDELQLMVEGGMSIAGALKSATYHPALFMGKEKELGQVKPGQLASMVLLGGNPLEDINNTRKIQAVFLRGKYLNRSDLDALLDNAKAISAKTESMFGN